MLIAEHRAKGDESSMVLLACGAVGAQAQWRLSCDAPKTRGLGLRDGHPRQLSGDGAGRAVFLGENRAPVSGRPAHPSGEVDLWGPRNCCTQRRPSAVVLATRVPC